MPTYEFQCTVCDSINVEQFRMAERPDHIKCACGGRANYIISMPNLMVKEAMLDGTRRKGFAELKEANKLNRERDNIRDSGKRKRIADEIKKLRGASQRKDGI